MKKKLLLTMMLIATLLIATSCEEDPIKTTGSITGTVTEQGTNTPIAAVSVTLSGISQSYQTGTDGKFEIKDLEESDYIITVSKSGYITDKKQISVKADKTMTADFNLAKE